jgi:RNA polymerase sigma factor (sigma-70 family)
MQRTRFEDIYEKFHRAIFNYVRAKVQEDELARELTQEVFLKVHRFGASYREEYAVSTWLWTIARNTVFDHFRSVGSAIEVAFEEEPAGRDTGAERALSRREDFRALWARLRKLTRLQRRVVWMQLVHQLSHAEIAVRLDTSLASVKNAAYRARNSLGAALTLVPMPG